jgi:hypothetical protein
MTSLRVAGLCGVAAFVVFNGGWIAGDAAQPAAFSPADDDISDLGAMTASSPWLYNRAANLAGLLVIVLGIGLWRAMHDDSTLGQVGAAMLIVAGGGTFLDGMLRLDCQGIDAGCVNDSWHAHGHKLESGVTAAATLLAVLLLALAFRRVPGWRRCWLPTIATVPAIFGANLVFSAVGAGAATRAGTVVLFAWIAFMGVQLLQTRGHNSALAARGARSTSG